MSRIGKLPIKLADKMKVSRRRAAGQLRGPQGQAVRQAPRRDEGRGQGRRRCTVVRPNETRAGPEPARPDPHHPRQRGQGRVTGFERTLDIRGVGFRAEVKGKAIHFSLGYSHPVVFDLPEGVTAEVDKAPRTEDSLPDAGSDPALGGQARPLGADRGEDPRAAPARAVQGQGHQVRRGDASAARKARPVRPSRVRQRRALGTHPAAEGLIAAGRKRKQPWPSRSALKRKNRIRKKLSGTTERPRLTVYKSLKHIYAQVMDDSTGKTLAYASSLLQGAQGQGRGRQEGRRQARGHAHRREVQGGQGRRGGVRPQRLPLPRSHRRGG